MNEKLNIFQKSILLAEKQTSSNKQRIMISTGQFAHCFSAQSDSIVVHLLFKVW